MSRLVTLENQGDARFRALTVHPGGHILLDEGEMVQAFEAIVDWFGMDLSMPLSAYVGYWEEEAWGRDPRAPWPTQFQFEGHVNLAEQEGGYAADSIELIHGDEEWTSTSLSAVMREQLGFTRTGRRARIQITVLPDA